LIPASLAEARQVVMDNNLFLNLRNQMLMQRENSNRSPSRSYPRVDLELATTPIINTLSIQATTPVMRLQQ
jgi:hypothetical protein